MNEHLRSFVLVEWKTVFTCICRSLASCRSSWISNMVFCWRSASLFNAVINFLALERLLIPEPSWERSKSRQPNSSEYVSIKLSAEERAWVFKNFTHVIDFNKWSERFKLNIWRSSAGLKRHLCFMISTTSSASICVAFSLSSTRALACRHDNGFMRKTSAQWHWINKTRDASDLCQTDERLELTGGDGRAVRCLILFAQLQIKVLKNPCGLCGQRGVNVMSGVTHILPQKLVWNKIKILSRKNLLINTKLWNSVERRRFHFQ